VAASFDRVDHDILIDRLRKRIGDGAVIRLIRAYLNSGIIDDGVVQTRTRGTPQGGPLSPLLANVLLDEVDKALERRGHCFVRYADDANVYVRSRRAGERVMALLRRLYGKLRLTLNETKSAVTSVFGRKFPGYSFWVAPGGVIKRKVAVKPLMTFKQHIRQLTCRSGGRSMQDVVDRLLPMFGDGRRTSGWRKRHGSGENSTSGCVIGCAPSSSSSGSAVRPCTGNG
jgi:RNA-directed DNA polymerase